jgi:hypothetical protein
VLIYKLLFGYGNYGNKRSLMTKPLLLRNNEVNSTFVEGARADRPEIPFREKNLQPNCVSSVESDGNLDNSFTRFSESFKVLLFL